MKLLQVEGNLKILLGYSGVESITGHFKTLKVEEWN